MKKLRIVWVLLLCLVTSLAVFAACDNTKSPQGGKDDPPPQVENVFEGITFLDETFTYDGTEKSLEVKNLPEGVSVVYENNSKTDAGSYTVSAKLTKGEEEKSFSATLTINKAPLVVTAENKTVKYGTDMPEFTVTYSGFVNEETVSVLGGELAFEKMSASLPVGTYKITPKGLTANNYEIEYKKGNLTVTPQDLTGATIANTVTEFTSESTEIDLSASLLPADNVEKGVTWSLKSGGDSDWFTLDGNKLLCPVKKSIPLDTVFPKKITVVLTTDGVNSDGYNITDEKEFTVNYRDEKYEITNEDELINALCVNINKKYILKNDIILNKYKNGLNGITGPNGAKWRTTVSGVFDGDGYTISGLSGTSTNYYGFFHQINEGAIVENLRLSGSIETNATYGAGFANTVAGKVRNCINEIDIKTTERSSGFVVTLATTGSIENCIQLGKVEHGSTQANIDNTGSFTGGGDGSAYTNCFFVASKTGFSTFGPGKWYAETGLTDDEYYSANTYTAIFAVQSVPLLQKYYQAFNTLYLDKPLFWHSLVQAYSRTNRIFKETKQYGQIVTFRNIKAEQDKALKLFSGDGNPNAYLLENYDYYVAEYADRVSVLRTITPSVDIAGRLQSEDDQRKFIIAFRLVAQTLTTLKTFSKFDWNDLNITFKDIKAFGEYTPYNIIPWNYASYKNNDTLQVPWETGYKHDKKRLTQKDVWQTTSNVCGLKGHPLENVKISAYRSDKRSAFCFDRVTDLSIK